MVHRLRRWLTHIPLTDPIELQQAFALQWFLLGWIILATILNLTSVLLPPRTGPSVPVPGRMPLLSVVISSLLICPVAALVLLRRGRFKLSVAVATLGLLLAHSMATYLVGVTSVIMFIVYQIPIALAGLLAGRRLLLTVSGVTIAVMIVVTILQSFSPPLAGFMAAVPGPDGVLVSPLIGQPAGLNVAFFVGVTLLVTLLLDRFGGALRVALTTALDREDQLKDIRASLEETVAERTSALQTALNDVQARAEEQARLLGENEQQRAMIRDLSVPVIPISATTLVLPLVGALDSTRLRQLQEQSLHALERTSARTLVFDITGVPIVDTQVAQGLLLTVRAARLLGAEVALVGIRPEVAQSIVGLGLELRDVSTFSDLQSALEQIAVGPSLSRKV